MLDSKNSGVNYHYWLLCSKEFYHIYPKYSDTSTPSQTWSKIWTSTIYYPILIVSKNCWMSGKQCRPWWDATFCIISSGSTLFAQAWLSEYSNYFCKVTHSATLKCSCLMPMWLALSPVSTDISLTKPFRVIKFLKYSILSHFYLHYDITEESMLKDSLF